MSLEQAILENTAAINRLADLIEVTKTLAPAQGVVAVDNAPSSSPVNGSSCPSPPDDAAVEATGVETPVASDVTYEQVSKAITTLATTKGRQAAIDVLQGFGYKRGNEAKPEEYAAIIAACEAA